MEYEPREDEEPDVKDQMMAKIRQNDPFELRLKPIDQDTCRLTRQRRAHGLDPEDFRRRREQSRLGGPGTERRHRESAVVRVAGGKHDFPPQTALLRVLRWASPGNGVKFTRKKYHPQFFFDIQEETNEQPIQN